MDLLQNEQNMKKRWEPDQPIENLYEQIEEGAKFARMGGASISDKQKVAIAYQMIHQTEELNVSCRDWRKRPTEDKTWTHFKTFFTQEYKDYKQDVSETMASIYKIMPLSLKNNVLTVAMSDPQNVAALDDLRNFLGVDVRGAVSNELHVTQGRGIGRHGGPSIESGCE